METQCWQIAVSILVRTSALFEATLAISSFTKGKSQLSQQEVECSQKLVKVRIHVESNENKLQSIIPVSLVKCTDDKKVSIDKIVTVCAALTNFV